MLNPLRWLLWLLPCLVCAFIVALVHLFNLRYASGDVHPAYSSLRTDPLGAKALFESFRRVGHLEARRNLQPLAKLEVPLPMTLFWLGSNVRDLKETEESLVKEWEALALRGNRVVISFSPEAAKPWRPEDSAKEAKPTDRPASRNAPPKGVRNKQDEPASEPAKKPGRTRPGPGLRPPGEPASRVSLEERWGLMAAFRDLPRDERDEAMSVEAHLRRENGLPRSIPCHTALVFRQLAPAWRVIYAREAEAVLIEKRMGNGAIVLSADSYLFSNQALRQDRYPELLAWLVGPNATVVFDETHLGTSEQPGVAALARKYRLGGVVAGLLLVAGLFIWKSSFSLVPAPTEGSATDAPELVGGRDAASGLVNLLRRSIPARDILLTCFDQWEAAHVHDRALLHGKRARMKAVLDQEQARPAELRSPVTAYQKLSRIRAERK
jgi:hypothetical protein